MGRPVLYSEENHKDWTHKVLYESGPGVVEKLNCAELLNEIEYSDIFIIFSWLQALVSIEIKDFFTHREPGTPFCPTPLIHTNLPPKWYRKEAYDQSYRPILVRGQGVVD